MGDRALSAACAAVHMTQAAQHMPCTEAPAHDEQHARAAARSHLQRVVCALAGHHLLAVQPVQLLQALGLCA
jgi:hypothetical protein